jgi:hypothetical protein
MPRDAPVTTATLPSSAIACTSLTGIRPDTLYHEIGARQMQSGVPKSERDCYASAIAF